MKVFLHYEDNADADLHKSLKITLPKSWKTGPASNLLDQFVESYNGNAKFADRNFLEVSDLHLAMRQEVAARSNNKEIDNKTELVPICIDAVVVDEIPDRMDVYICHGPSQTMAERRTAAEEAEKARQAELQNTVACTHFGCQNRFPKGGPYPECLYHKSPPIFHETAKWWSCCPDKKAWDFDDFQKIPGCQKGRCTDVKEEQKMFLGGTDLREQVAETANLKSIDDFNKAQSAGGAAAAPVLDRLKTVLVELGMDQELFDQVVEGLKRELLAKSGLDSESTVNEVELLNAVAQELGSKFKGMFKETAAEQLRIK